MKILSIETSGKTFSTALNENDKTIASSYYEYGHIHSEIIITAIERLLKDTNNSFENIDKFALSVGPGSFTGIRVAMTAIKTFAQVLNKQVVAIDTLSILEASLPKIKGIKVISTIDALRNEVYIKKGKKIIIKNIDSFIRSLKTYKNKVIIIGNAAIVYKEELSKGLGSLSVSLPEIMHMPKASVLANLAYKSKNNLSYNKVQPLYIRKSWAEESKK
ncbi:MAG: tRNA (adenosine(37)-N6)-threonylcarbamoyltransferase complex dimerization subunit type 1 TsaB [Endomicrobium sp.]|jgi:tRNA threonylcarbamoyl adenosine modification protein YeaZ|uniref:tRNA (adenosine(37)-N6)-threonylcarbamoyltransferase complex dimerization subunit type 1 TsaB n=1 Tax=Candidatus Endomicrobiellum cubanum TaxID=3242325 RepID=UPI0028247863|nr:tRNA (adenosine(37)-N6)-threonylcarbamoyltransferase complex dimerization subunit type 1 TsaB [Endomicrobium sp.]